MSILPPVEQAQLQTHHLPVAPTAPPPDPAQFKKSGFSFSTLSGLNIPQVNKAHLGLFVVGFAVPLALLFLAQPAKPSFNKQDKQLMANYVGQQQKQQPLNENSPTPLVASANETNDGTTPAETAAEPTPANLVSTDATNTDLTDPLDEATTTAQLADSGGNKTYRYHITIAKGFLDKAVQLSKQTAQQQSTGDRAQITEYIDKALEAANKAIDLDSTQGSGFLMRARIYQTATVLRPELAEYAKQDREIAEALGINGQDLTGDTNPLDLLPTQQASDPHAGPIVADTEEGSDTQVDSTQTNNVEQGQVTMKAGSNEVKVDFPGLQSDHALRVDIADLEGNNPDNATFHIQSRTDGEGFTIKASEFVSENVVLDWRAIQALE